MEAPEKIFICDYGSEVSYEWHSESEFETKGHNDIEYTRTDAFIEKACEGIEHLLSGYIIRNFHFGDSYEMDTLIEDFKKYMEK